MVFIWHILQEDFLELKLWRMMLMIKETTYFTRGDSGSCINVVSTMLIKRLQIPTQDHSKPYKLQWLNDSGTMKVISQALISFTLGKYKDEVLCDMLPKHPGDILLDRPW